MPAQPTFVAYIDESGDQRIKFSPTVGGPGSSEWFILSAAIVRQSDDNTLVKLVRDVIRNDFKKTNRNHVLHFRKLSHPQKVLWTIKIAMSPCVAISVVLHKPNLVQSTFAQDSRLYFYATRLLVERISWFCRDNRSGQSGLVRMIFANRTNLSYDELRQYIDRVRNYTANNIHWPVIDTDLIQPQQPANRICLQIADAVASGILAAVEYSPYGFTESRYVETIKPRVYCRFGKYRSYGMKFFPKIADEMAGQAPRFGWLTTHYPT